MNNYSFVNYILKLGWNYLACDLNSQNTSVDCHINVKWSVLQCRGKQMFSVKDQIVNMLGFAGHEVSVATRQLYPCSAKAATDSVRLSRDG